MGRNSKGKISDNGGESPIIWLQSLFFYMALFLLLFLIFSERPGIIDLDQKKLKVKECRIFGLWWGALVSFFFSVVGFFIAGFDRGIKSKLGSHIQNPGRVFWWVLLLLMLLGGVVRAPRLTHSFWNDEEYAFRKYSWGKLTKSIDEGEVKFKPVTWEKALFYNHTGNNHILHTINARTSIWVSKLLGVWPKNQAEFYEWVPRMPPFLIGLATIGAIGWLGFMLGGVKVGLLSALFLMLSPWHIRYSVEARGYSAMLFFIVLSLNFLVLALRSGEWRWWLSVMGAQALMLLSFAGSLPIAVATGLVVLFVSWKKWSHLVRFSVSALLFAVPVLFLMGPSIPQIIIYLKRDDVLHVNSAWAWLRDLSCHVVTGVPWHKVEYNGASGIGVLDFGYWMVGGICLALVLASIGIYFLCRKKMGFVVVGLLALAMLMLAENVILGDSPMHVWYLLPLLILFCLGGASVFSRLPKWGLGILLLGYLGMINIPIKKLMSVPRHPIREVVDMKRSIAEEAVKVVFGVSDRQMRSYGPDAFVVESRDELLAIEVRAKEQNKRVLVSFCGVDESKLKRPEVMSWVKENGNYKRLGKVAGFEPMFSYEVWGKFFAR